MTTVPVKIALSCAQTTRLELAWGCRLHPVTEGTEAPSVCKHNGPSSAGENYPASKASTGIAGRLGLVIIRTGVDDKTAADDAGRPGPNGNDVKIGDDLGAAPLVGLECRQIAGMAYAAGGMAMHRPVWIEMPFGAHAVTRTAIANFMDVQSVLLPRLEALHEYRDLNLVANLLESRLTKSLVALGRL